MRNKIREICRMELGSELDGEERHGVVGKTVGKWWS